MILPGTNTGKVKALRNRRKSGSLRMSGVPTPTVSTVGVQTETKEERDCHRRDSTRGGRGRAGLPWRDARHALRHAKREGARAVRLHGMTFWLPTKAPTLTTSVGAQTGDPAAPPVSARPKSLRQERNALRQKDFYAAKDAAKVAAAMPSLLAEATERQSSVVCLLPGPRGCPGAVL